eukprot:5592475-Karenia_brevis.AAC.1
MTITQRPLEVRTLQQVKPDRFGGLEGEEEGLKLTWDEAKTYMDEHGLGGDKGVFVDRAQEDYVTDLGL